VLEEWRGLGRLLLRWAGPGENAVQSVIGVQAQAVPEFMSMFDKIGASARVGLTLALGYTLVGCGATGLAWVDEPETASGWSESEQRSLANTPVPPSHGPAPVIPAVADAEPAQREGEPQSHQRLNHTITLGEVDVAAPSAEAAPAYGPNVSVTINNYGQSPAPGYASYYSGYGGFGVARGSSFGRSSPVTGASRSSGSMQPGQNWPAVSDHGTSFPYRSAPASPWR
jgi:hypothetical protein